MLTRRLLILICLLTSACRIGATEPRIPPAQAQQLIILTATPAPASSQAAPISSNVQPALLLQLGESQMRHGYFAEAAELFRSMLAPAGALASAIRDTVMFRLAEAEWLAGDNQTANAEYGNYIAANPAGAHLPRAYFLRGEARLASGDFLDAIADFQYYLRAQSGIIDSYVHERIASAQLAMGQRDAAIASFQQAIEASRAKVPLVILREDLARIFLDAGRIDDAVAQYDAILAVAQKYGYRASISYAAADALMSGGHKGAGIERLNAIVSDYIASAYAWLAINDLAEQGIGFDDLTIGKAAYNAGDYAAAIEAFLSYIEKTAAADVAAEIYLMLGRAHRQIGNVDAALIAFQTIIDDYAADSLLGDALLERGRTYFLTGNNAQAIELYLAIADTQPLLAQAAGEALWRAGYLYNQGGQIELSRTVFQRLAAYYPAHELGADGISIAAQAADGFAEFSSAINLYAQLAEMTHGAERASASLRLGQLQAQAGGRVAAVQSWSAAIEAAPDSFEAARADDLARGRQPFSPSPAFRFQFDVAAERLEADNWLRQRFGIEQNGELWRPSAELNADARLVRARELLSLHQYSDAKAEIESLLDAKASNATHSYQLAVLLSELGAYRESIIAAANVIIAAGGGTLNAPPYIARLRFPAHYIELIYAEANARDIDPLLMLSLIRQESLFDTRATAAAGEKGMMQVIPSTAQYIADKLAWQNYQHSDLFRPYAGIAFGAFYIDEQLELFEQDSMAALAAYNAGPGTAYNWHVAAAGDPDEFLNAISIDSTRRYVQLIYRNFNIYRELYGAAPPA